MERRLSERVQFFQLFNDTDVVPVWIFQQEHPDSILGLLLNIGQDGVQILTDKSAALLDTIYRLIVQADESSNTQIFTAPVRLLWSRAVGTLYVRNGFGFMGEDEPAPLIESLCVARSNGQQWLRCELALI